ncbi:transcription factor/nuclear export subunit protein 2-domain-containing protein [Pisolithus marmoratus]|nr:transcription factor/nuclear export subunit protein 2-domain-containing protein [Pisolithus marmoratus]
MDVIDKIAKYLETWTKGGEVECRNFIIALHSSPINPNDAVALNTAYQKLLFSVLKTWSPKPPLTPQAVASFVQSVLHSLPSSSAQPGRSTNNDAYGEMFVDLIWSIDAHLDELLMDSKTILAASDLPPAGQESKDVSRVSQTKQLLEQDKDILTDIVRRFLSAKIIDIALCRERLDVALLSSIGLITDRSAFDKKEIRTRTGLFYKQNKFNLLREQTEGYSKLTVELSSSLGPPHSALDARPTESFASIQERARAVWAKVMSLIGYFDLDPNRALDIILDVLTVNLAAHYHFFLSLLSFSPWAGSYKRPTDAKPEASMAVDSVSDLYTGKTFDEVLRIAESLSQGHTGSKHGTDKSGSQVLAQVLGFKFTHYQFPDANEQSQRNVYLTAAILIREGFITLDDLYPHLSPVDADMESYRRDYLDQVQERISTAKVNQLAMAGPLESANSGQKPRVDPPEETKKTPVFKAPNQKAGLASALLAVGALRPAVAILTRFPWLVDAHVEIADIMLRILKHSVAPIYDSAFVLKERNLSFTRPRARFGPNGVIQVPTRRPQLTLIAPTPPSTTSTDFIFFFPDWSERVPMSTTHSDLIDVIEPLMSFIGPHVSRDSLFVSKVTRLGRSQLIATVPLDPVTKKPSGEPDSNHPVRLFWYKMLRKYFLPALSLIRGNAVCTVEIWNVIRQYETTARWRLYGEWRQRTYNSHPELRIRQVQADRESKGILRRLSHNTIDTLSGTVAKLVHSNPAIFFTNVVNQIMAYDNLASVVIQALRYVTNMGFDVLVFIILDALSNPHKNRVKDDGVNISDWLQSLASFTGMLFRRYSADYLHIVVLKELIWKMAGIEPLPSLSDSQISAMAGGPALRIEAVASTTRGARLDPSDAVLKGPHRLGKTLIENNLALPLLIQVAQQRQSCVFRTPDAHLKSLSKPVRHCRSMGYCYNIWNFLPLPSVVTPEDYANKILPPLAELGELYGISAPICMQIIRPMLNHTLLKTALSIQEKERAANEEAEKRLKAHLTAAKRDPSVTPRLDTPNGANTSRDSHDQKTSSKGSRGEDSAMEVEADTTIPPAESPWIPELEELFEDVRKIAKTNAIDVIGPAFYLTFWQLSMYDLTPPASRYDEEGVVLRTLSHQEDHKYIHADRSTDRAKRLSASAHRARRDRYTSFVNTLAQEFKEQLDSRSFTLKRLAREKQHWFAHVEHRSAVLASAIIEHCIQPRCLLSPMDADYCAQIIKVIHTQGTPGFPTLMVYDKLLGDHVKAVIFSCSEYEAKNYGRFLLSLLADLWKWAQDEQLFAQDNRMKIAGKTALLPGFQPRWTNKDLADIRPEDEARKSTWPNIIESERPTYCQSLCSCIETGEFMHVYNTIIVLKEILPVFPMAAVSDYGPVIDLMVEKLVESEERGDLKILGRAYSAALKKREPLWTVPRPIPKQNGVIASPKPASQLPDKARATQGTSTVPTPSSTDTRRDGLVATPNIPTAPRAQTANGSAQMDRPSTPTNSTKLAMDSIPRPEKVKRVRPEIDSQSPAPESEMKTPAKSDIMEVDFSSASKEDSPRFQEPPTDTRAPTPTPPSRPNRMALPNSGESMPPPIAPSQTLSAQELRETAKQTMGQRSSERPDGDRKPTDSRSQPGSKASSPLPQHRSSSPPPRAGTRNHSQESRTSGGRPSDRGDIDRSDERTSDRELRQEPRGMSRRDNGVPTMSRGERSARERGPTRESDRDRESDRERDRERTRDRHGGGERDRERDKEREKDRDRERRERDRERDRDRDRDRDRHRRDDKDRDRESRKERDGSGRMIIPTGPTATPEGRAVPTRPDPVRHRSTAQPIDDALGKRRRPTDDETDRTSKRSSRKESHRDDRSRRSEKESHDRGRESDRRRTERELSDSDSRPPPADKPIEKRIPDGPKTLPPTTPSAPRAMSAADPSRSGSKADTSGRSSGDWKSHRDHTTSFQGGPGSGSNVLDTPPSLRSRIGEKEAPRSAPPAGLYRSSELPLRDDDRDNRKRTLAERDKEMEDPNSSVGDISSQPLKRPRINRHRYTPVHGGLAKRTLPIDPQAGDKPRAGRKDQ